MHSDAAIDSVLLRLSAAFALPADHVRFRSHSVLMKEFLRRAALWADALDVPEWEPPFSDLAARIVPEVRAPAAVLAALHAAPTQEMREAAETALHWAAVADRPETQRFGLPNPFEPHLLLCERGGHFWIEDGLIRIGIVGMAVRTWRLRAKFAPAAIDPAALDALDASA